MRWRIPLVVALVAFVAVSCDQQPVEPLEDAAVTAPVLDFTNGPPQSGPYVSRYDDGLFAVNIFGEDVWAFAHTGEGFCGLDLLQQMVPYLAIDNPSDGGTVPLVMEVWSGDINVIVGTWPISCLNVVATGVVKFRLTDNDRDAWMEGADRNRVNSFMVRVNGKVDMLADGSTANLNALFRQVWTGWPDEIVINIVEFAKLN